MSRWVYDTAHPPPQAWEAADGAAALIAASGLVSGEVWLGTNAALYAHEDPVTPVSDRYVVVREYQEAGGRMVDDSGLLTARLHVKVVSPLSLPNWRRWHAAMHNRIARALVGQLPTLTLSAPGWNGFRQTHEPSRPETYDEATRESFALYAITLQSLNA